MCVHMQGPSAFGLGPSSLRPGLDWEAGVSSWLALDLTCQAGDEVTGTLQKVRQVAGEGWSWQGSWHVLQAMWALAGAGAGLYPCTGSTSGAYSEPQFTCARAPISQTRKSEVRNARGHLGSRGGSRVPSWSL